MKIHVRLPVGHWRTFARLDLVALWLTLDADGDGVPKDEDFGDVV